MKRINSKTNGRAPQTLSLFAMSLNIATHGHPNKMPFTGVLTRLDTPSDYPPGGSGPGGVYIDPGRDREGLRGDCEELRSACLHKDELGEEGEGNCLRYRETCKDPD